MRAVPLPLPSRIDKAVISIVLRDSCMKALDLALTTEQRMIYVNSSIINPDRLTDPG